MLQVQAQMTIARLRRKQATAGHDPLATVCVTAAGVMIDAAKDNAAHGSSQLLLNLGAKGDYPSCKRVDPGQSQRLSL